jgi:hypothetical protein
VTLLFGDCVLRLRELASDSLDSLVTDPPAGIGFMGKGWDSDKGGRDAWVSWLTEVMRECYRVLKPGAHGLVWAIPRTSHWTAMALEDAGFEVRDVVTHLFGSGFPKSLDVSKAIDKAAGAEREIVGRKGGRYASPKQDFRGGQHHAGSDTQKTAIFDAITAPATDAARQWQGFGTALKPAVEFWWLIRKPLGEKTVAANVLKHGTGALNIDGCRIGTESTRRPLGKSIAGGQFAGEERKERASIGAMGGSDSGRFPANLVLSHDEGCDETCVDSCAVRMLDEQSGPNCGAAAPVRKKATPRTTNVDNYKPHASVGDDGKSFRADYGGASRFFYVAKASKSDRNRKAKP